MKPESPEETHGHWVTRLRSEVRNCEFDKMNNDEAIKLVQALHTRSTRLQKEIISKDLTLTCALEYAQALELTDKEITFMKNNSIAPENPSVQSLRKRPTKAPFGGNRTENSGPSWKQRIGRYCGRDFPHKNICPAKHVTCNVCGKRGHFAKVCESRPPKVLPPSKTISTIQEAEYDCNVITMDQVTLINHTSTSAREVNSEERKYPETDVKIKVNNQYIRMQVDSGVDADVINENIYNSLVPKPHLRQTSSKLKPYNSKPIHVKGYFIANFQANGKKSESRVYVTNGNKCNNLLGKYT